jgi:DNA excision repair protein ERCC-1
MSVTQNPIIANRIQRQNPIIPYIKNAPIEYADIPPDFILGASTCAIFTSLKYHILHPTTVHNKISKIGKSYRLRVLLAQIDLDDNMQVLVELNKICFINEITLILAWSPQEAARYLETFKVYENKAPTAIKEKVETEFAPLITSILTNIRSINRTDVVTLLEGFGNLKNLCNASEHELMLCPGLGEKKVKRLHNVLHAPFKKKTIQLDQKSVHISTDFSSEYSFESHLITSIKSSEETNEIQTTDRNKVITETIDLCDSKSSADST